MAMKNRTPNKFPDDRPAGRVSDVNFASLGKAIRHARLGRSMTQRELAVRAGLATKWVERIESGGFVNPKLATLMAIAGALGLTVAELLKEPAKVPPRPKPLRRSQKKLIELIEIMDAGQSAALLRIAEYMATAQKGGQ